MTNLKPCQTYPPAANESFERVMRNYSIVGNDPRRKKLRPIAFQKMAAIQDELAKIEKHLALLQKVDDDEANGTTATTTTEAGGADGDKAHDATAPLTTAGNSDTRAESGLRSTRPSTDDLISPAMAPMLNVELCHLAAAGDVGAVRTLLDAGADPNSRDYDDRTLLHIASMHGHLAVVKVLLDFGADYNLLDRDGATALDVVRRLGHVDVEEALCARMAEEGVAPPDSYVDQYLSTASSPMSQHVPDFSSVPQPMVGSLIIIMMGLPGRGKTYVAQQIRRYFQWNGLACAIFSHQAYRKRAGRQSRAQQALAAAQQSADNAKEEEEGQQPQQQQPGTSGGNAGLTAPDLEEHVAFALADDMTRYVTKTGGVAILDGTQSTPSRRHAILRAIRKTRRIKSTRVIVVEIVNNNKEVILGNILRAKEMFPNPPENFVELYCAIMAQHEAVYRTLNPITDSTLSYIRIDQENTSLNMISGWMPSRLAYMLHNLSHSPTNLYLTRPGEYADMISGHIGGNSRLTTRGEAYGEALYNYFRRELPPPTSFSIMASCAKRCTQTVHHFTEDYLRQADPRAPPSAAGAKTGAAPLNCRVSFLPTLDDINHGDCEGMRFVDVLQTMPSTLQYMNADPYYTAWPNGECIHQVFNSRLEPHIHDIQASSEPVLVVSHLHLLQGLYAYFVTGEDRAVAPQNAFRISIPYECVIKIHMVGVHRVADIIDLAADVNRIMQERTGDIGCCLLPETSYNVYRLIWNAQNK